MLTSHSILAFIPSMPGWAEIMVVAFFGLLLFGRRLPEVGRSLGKGIVEFKKGLRGIEDDMESGMDSTDRALPRNDETPAPKSTEQQTEEHSEVGSGQ
jgi:sec-independent protein translocase protein TatA